MPRGDGTGPRGEGPGRFGGQGRGRCGRGGHGFRNRFHETGLTGRQRAERVPVQDGPGDQSGSTPANDELAGLRIQAQSLEASLQEIRERLAQLEGQAPPAPPAPVEG